MRTRRIIDAGLACVEHALEAAKQDGVESKVGHQLREAGLYLAAAYATLAPDEDEGD